MTALNRSFEIIWITLLSVFVLVESIALSGGRTGDTFSEFIWAITRHNAARFTLAGFLVWLIFHLVGGPGRF